jgi:streptogramin lyase
MFKRLLLAAAMLFVAVSAIAGSPSLEFLGASSSDLANPHDLKLSPDGRHLLVSDVGNNRVVILDPETLAPLGAFGADHQSGTHDVEFDADGRVYVADTHNARVTVYEMKGLEATLVDEIKGALKGPEGVLAHPNGRIYVAGAWSGNVIAYKDGKPVKELKGLSSPHDLERLANGDIWLSDSGNNRLLLLSPDLEIKRELRGSPYNFNGVRYMDVMEDGTLIVGDKNNHQIKIISADGELLKVIGSGRGGKGPGEFRTPEGVEIRGETVWLSDSGNNRVVKYRITTD